MSTAAPTAADEFLKACENNDWQAIVKMQDQDQDQNQDQDQDLQIQGLHIAAKNGHFDACAVILDKHRDIVDATDSMGLTPLYKAVLGTHENVFHLLIRRGANILHNCFKEMNK